MIFGILTVAVFALGYPAGSFDLGDFKATPFLVQFGAVAGYQISWAIYVSDYSRYLPPDVTVRKTVFWTYWGSALGGIWLMCLGAALAAWAGAKFDTIASLKAAGDTVFGGLSANLAGIPATSVPAGFDRLGLPVGLQIMGPRWADARTLAAAEAFEREVPWTRFVATTSPQ